ncbi:hypothetical protein [Planococcus glaciei]|uniref:hypothetical protein n=1 Tax=Planococcus glaciei TaxID=459472 RepID=UPI001C7307EE|nr:hypothetical protein [Planococcus glaciei]MBX0313282.1 hypothetical protein [Planococcus glaciei]
MKIGIIISPERKTEKIISAIKEYDVEFEIINILDDNWEKSFQKTLDGYLIYPPSFPEIWKQIFLKRLILLEEILKGKALPSVESIMIYESKISMLDYFKINNLPFINSHTFFNYSEAIEYGKKCNLPVVLKEDAGSGALGVNIINSRRKLLLLIKKSFFISSKVRKSGFKTLKKSFKAHLYPYKIFFDSSKSYLPKSQASSGYIHVQDFLAIRFEWRIIKIGNSYFGHKKLEDMQGYHSGSLNKEWGPVSFELLNLVKKWATQLDLESMCFDIFEDYEGNYYINELQVMFGTSTEHQLVINDMPGRYVYENKWKFEEGDFARNGCNNLRIQTLIEKIQYI